MSTFNGNPYYHPEKCGLVILNTLEANLSYEFDIFVLWKDIETGRVYFGHDSGCSCPTPFEDFNSLSDMVLVTWNSLDAIYSIMHSEYSYNYFSPESIQGMMRSARFALMGR